MEQKTRAAVSGNSKVGIPARLRMSRPAATSVPPIHEARTGFPVWWAYALRCSAVSVGSAMPWGQVMASRPSLPGSCAAISRTFAKRSGSASPRTSMGLLWLQWGGRILLRASVDSEASLASSPPFDSRPSAAKTPGPPALVTIARRGPLGRGCFDSTSAM